MDLRRMKTVFIFVLLGINIMLSMVLYSARSYERQEKQTMVENLSGFLAKNMIYLPNTVTVPDSPEIYNFYLEKMFGSDHDLIEKFLGQNYENHGEGSFKSTRGTFSVESDVFKFYKSNPSDLITDFSQEKIEKLCRKEMDNLGVMSEVYEFNGFNYVDDGIRAIFTVKRNDDEFFDAYISFDVSEKGIFSVSGKNIISDLSVSGGSSPYYSVASILADLVKNEKLDPKISHTIVSIKPGYYIGKSAESYRNILAIPVWQIATDGGIILHYDARNGQEIEE